MCEKYSSLDEWFGRPSLVREFVHARDVSNVFACALTYVPSGAPSRHGDRRWRRQGCRTTHSGKRNSKTVCLNRPVAEVPRCGTRGEGFNIRKESSFLSCTASFLLDNLIPVEGANAFFYEHGLSDKSLRPASLRVSSYHTDAVQHSHSSGDRYRVFQQASKSINSRHVDKPFAFSEGTAETVVLQIALVLRCRVRKMR